MPLDKLGGTQEFNAISNNSVIDYLK